MCKPHDIETSNAPFVTYWTTPCCYVDICNSTAHQGDAIPCPECGRKVRLKVEDQPVYIATLVEDDEEEEEA